MASKEPAEAKRTIGAAVLEFMLDGATNEEALAKAQAEFPDAKPSPASISWYRNKFRTDGHSIPTARELRAAEKKRTDAAKPAKEPKAKKSKDPLDA